MNDWWVRPNYRIYNYDVIRHAETGATGSVLCSYAASKRAEVQWDNSVTVTIEEWEDLEAKR